jgi:hypothetical protein
MRILPQGRTIVASVERCTAERGGAAIVEIDGSQVFVISQPQSIADVILTVIAAVG